MVLLAGMGGTFAYAYIGTVYGVQSELLRSKMLIIIHIALFTVFGMGTWWQHGMAFK